MSDRLWRADHAFRVLTVARVVSTGGEPASHAGLPALGAEGNLETANSALVFATNGAQALGPLSAAALLPSVGVRGVLVVAPPAPGRDRGGRRTTRPPPSCSPGRPGRSSPRRWR